MRPIVLTAASVLAVGFTALVVPATAANASVCGVQPQNTNDYDSNNSLKKNTVIYTGPGTSCNRVGRESKSNKSLTVDYYCTAEADGTDWTYVRINNTKTGSSKSGWVDSDTLSNGGATDACEV